MVLVLKSYTVCLVSTKQCLVCRTTKKLPNRLPKYPVPERLRKCVVENKDVTTVISCLAKVSAMLSQYEVCYRSN